MNQEERIEEMLKAAGFGLIMFFGAVFSLMLNNDLVHLEIFCNQLFPLIAIYVSAAIVLRFIFSLEAIKKLSVLFSGAASIIWIFTAAIAMGVLSRVLEDYIRNIILTQLFIIAAIFIGNYLYMRYISKELNKGDFKKGFKLVEDLPHAPQNEDEFMDFIYSYCKKNALELEVISYGMPAIVKIDGELNEVSPGSYMSLYAGVISTMEFKNIS